MSNKFNFRYHGARGTLDIEEARTFKNGVVMQLIKRSYLSKGIRFTLKFSCYTNFLNKWISIEREYDSLGEGVAIDVSEMIPEVVLGDDDSSEGFIAF